MNELTLLPEEETELSPLSTAEKRLFNEQESTIQNNLFGFLEVGKALKIIHDQRLYREHYTSFNRYLKTRWAGIHKMLSRQHAYRLIAAAEVAADIAEQTSPQDGDRDEDGPADETEVFDALPPDYAPTHETQLRPLAQVPAESRGEVWHNAIVAAEGKPPTAEDAQEAADAFAEGRPVRPRSERKAPGVKDKKKKDDKKSQKVYEAWAVDLFKGKRTTERYTVHIRKGDKERVEASLSATLRFLYDRGIIGFNLQDYYYVTDATKEWVGDGTNGNQEA